MRLTASDCIIAKFHDNYSMFHEYCQMDEGDGTMGTYCSSAGRGYPPCEPRDISAFARMYEEAINADKIFRRLKTALAKEN